MTSPDKVWVEIPDIFDGMGFWQEQQSNSLHEPKETVMTREHITAQIEALQKQLDAMPEKQRIRVTNSRIWPLSGPSTATHYFDIETINGVPHIHGVAMKEVEK